MGTADRLDRRAFIRTFSVAVGALAGGALLAACGGAAQPGANASATAKPVAPTSASDAASASASVETSRAASPKPATSGSSAASPVAGGVASPFKAEKATLKVGIPVDATTFLPVYIGADRTYKEQGLDVELLAFRGDAEVSQALAGDSLDFTCQSMNGLINMIQANQPVMGFYQGFYQQTFDWVAAKDVKTWTDLKGKSAGVSTFGSLTDFLTRYVLIKHGMQPDTDVHIEQVGGGQANYQLLQSGRLGVSILAAPQKWQAEESGYTLLGTQSTEVAPEWPIHIYIAKTKFMDENPNTLRDIVRAHVSALRLAKADKDYAAKIYQDRLKSTKAEAERSYDEVIDGYNERGTIPSEQSMSTFWQILVEGKVVDTPWAESKYLDHRLIDTFDQWAPT